MASISAWKQLENWHATQKAYNSDALDTSNALTSKMADATINLSSGRANLGGNKALARIKAEGLAKAKASQDAARKAALDQKQLDAVIQRMLDIRA